jgi:CRISPR-associated endonuclease Csn1
MPENCLEVKLLGENGSEVSAEETSYRPRLVFGLDVGIASVGYALLDFEQETIVTLGSHVFEAGENPHDGASLAEPRRLKRAQRRRLDRRRRRLTGLLKLCQSVDLINNLSLKSHTAAGLTDPWKLRVAALERKLSGEELARALFHLAKRRGFKETLKDEAKLRGDGDGSEKTEKKNKEERKMLEGISSLKADMAEAGSSTVAQFLLAQCQERPGSRLRNQDGESQHTITRTMAESEARAIIAHQRTLGRADALSENFESAYLKLAFGQRPLKSTYRLVGRCRFEADQKRAAKAGHSAELFILWSRLNNLRIRMDGSREEWALTGEEKKEVLAAAYQRKSGVSFAFLRNKIVQKNHPDGDKLSFNLVNYHSASAKAAKEADFGASVMEIEKKIKAGAEKAIFVQLPAWHRVKDALGVATDAWNRIRDKRAILDKIGMIITYCPDAEQALTKLLKTLTPFGVPEEGIKALAALDGQPFKGTVDLSFKALAKVLPRMENGERYDQAASAVYGSHSQMARGRLTLLPPVAGLRNPLVQRSLAQVRKVLNAIIRRYGLPDRIHIEVTRDLARNFEERQKYKREQGKYLAYLADLKKRAAEDFGCEEKDLEDRLLMKYRLWKEQTGLCLYSGESISLQQLIDPTAVQIDHALPYRRTYDDSFKNKVLVLTSQNLNKGNQTPYEFLGSLRWEEFHNRLLHLPSIPWAKKKHLGIRDLTDEVLNKFKARNLVDTGYIARTLKNHIESQLAPKPGSRPKWVQTRPGALTALLRKRWGLEKNRDESPRHHALDAAVLAASTEGMVQKAAGWRRDPDRAKRDYCPMPWTSFRQELLARLAAEDRPMEKLFVSRRPNRKFSGALHEDTLKSCRVSEDGGYRIIKRIKLTKLNLKTLEMLVDKDDRNAQLYLALKERLALYKDEAEKAFAEPFYHPARNGPGPRIHSVKIETTDKPGVCYTKWRSSTKGTARYGVADRGDMVRVDVFEKKGLFYLVPVYVCDLQEREMQDRYCVRGESDRSAWPRIDESFNFRFSLHKNDYVILEYKDAGKRVAGYYCGTNIATASISLLDPDAVGSADPRNRGSLGVKTLKSFQKCAVNILGEITVIEVETRQGLPRPRPKRSKGDRHGMANRDGGKSG